MSTADILILLRLLAAHLAADFMSQPRNWIEKKRANGLRAPQLYYHIAIVGVLTYLLLADWDHVLLPLFIMVTHLLIDSWKLSRPAAIRYFLGDQLAHLLMLIAGWLVYSGNIPEAGQLFQQLFYSPIFWTVFVSYIIVTWPFGYVVSMITSRWQKELTAEESDQLTGLANAGMWIGRTERFIILTFILLNQYSAIGFLIAAKSVFRFSGKLEGSRERKEAEYILIGTLLSFALAISVGIGAQYLIQLLSG